jgi:hypothetical protein
LLVVAAMIMPLSCAETAKPLSNFTLSFRTAFASTILTIDCGIADGLEDVDLRRSIRFSSGKELHYKSYQADWRSSRSSASESTLPGSGVLNE